MKDGYRNFITEHASSSNAISTLNSRSVGKYSVSLTLTDSDGNIVKHMGINDNMADFGLEGKSKAFWFSNVSCHKAGVYDLVVSVLNFNLEIKSWCKKLQVC